MSDYKNELEQAIRDGLSNHTGEFLNPWVTKLNLSHEDLAQLLEDIVSSKRLLKNLEALLSQHSKKRELEARVDELEWLKENIHHGDFDIYNPDDWLNAIKFRLDRTSKLTNGEGK